MMNSRERVLTALNHKEPDRVPFDLGGTVVTGIHAKAYRRLRQYLGLPEKEIVIKDIAQQIAQVDADVLDRLSVDVGGILPRPAAGFELKMETTQDRRYQCFHDEFQIGWLTPLKGGMYYDMFEHPLDGHITEEMVDAYGLPDPLNPARFFGLRESALKILEEEKRALVIGNISSGIFELYMWTRGFKDGYAGWAGNPELSKKILRKFMEFQLAYWEKMFEVMQQIPIDVVHMADDMAGQKSMLISPTSYRNQLKLFHKEMFDFIHSKSNAKIFFHSCGSVVPIIPDLIEIGVDILNPVQVSAANMDSADLKRQYGNDICFWGGGVDTQKSFDENHSPAEVRLDVRKRLHDFMPGGGFVFSTVHNIQGNVPAENILAMWETLQEFGIY
jgi:uroporphyrinogen decarboxylase